MWIYSLVMVSRRLIPLVAALAVAFAPVALAVCQASCAGHAVEPSMSASVDSAHHHHQVAQAPSASMPIAAGHAHHHAPPASMPASAANAAVLTGSHSCDHGEDLPASSGAVQHTLATADMAVASFAVPDVSSRPLAISGDPGGRSPSRIALTTQLRV